MRMDSLNDKIGEINTVSSYQRLPMRLRNHGTTMPKNDVEVFEMDEMMEMPESKGVNIK